LFFRHKENKTMKKQKTMTGAQQVLSILEKQGVTDVFGYPGGAIMPLYDALYDSGIKHYLCRHEQGAAFAALGYARASYRVGVCMATSGPGATNLLTGIADAMSDSVPLVAITGQVATKAMGTDGFQEVDIIGLSLACTKHCFQVKDIKQLPEYLNKAFEIAQSGRPGPVLIDIPKDIQMTEVLNHDSSLHLIEAKKGIEKAERQSAGTTMLFGQAAEMIIAAEKPIFYIGGGVGLSRSVAELRDLVDMANIPSVETLKALGSVNFEDSLYLGMLGMHGTKAANLAVQESDLLVVLGARFDDRVTGKLEGFAPNAKVIHMDIDPAEVNKRRKADIALIGDLKTTLPMINKEVDKQFSVIKISNKDEWRSRCLDLKKRFQPEISRAVLSNTASLLSTKPLSTKPLDDKAKELNKLKETIFAPALLRELSGRLRADAIVTTDVGQHQMWVAQTMQFDHPSRLITSGGLGTMGFGIPTAIGAKISSPRNTVVSVTGDGSFMMNIQELATIKRYQIPVKIVLIDNARLGMVRQWQELFFNRRFSETDLSDNPDFVMLARSFGIESKTITQAGEVSEAIEEMLECKNAYLLHVKIDALDNVWPLVPPDTANDQMIEKTA
jgi:acetolactate synthase-1/2/3 large subunit